MGRVKTLNKWANAHTYYALDLLRIALGVFLLIKGTLFMSNPVQFIEVMQPFANMPGSWLIIHYVVAAHFVGGLLIILGLFTRWSVITQFPILAGAILVNFFGTMNVSNLLLASLVLIVCVFFLFYGSGKHSADYYLKMQK
ncbi:DoxX family protein [Zeaxanthinibacter enoshimensis]|uniref:Putative membrane protein YphA (DoxX/SURF4 family) n=1 Tax=Zeaxanthinibacter enoshimensis TaxID=392009 RepID=A0A4R6TRS8_9FLAO|nr:DoxX family protein [Zeaxanthinibacter enoshimensis]TDQ32853.1 putative membrane protein YphA (DoxX/SURF4 family) [Zeaxanthinibacter enoshimensis]